MPRVSVIIPAYNAERYLSETIASAASQTLEDIEILIIDDGSTDATLDIAQEAMSGDARIKVLSQQNGGVSSARNRGMLVATGDYFSFLDADDYYGDTKTLQRLFEAAEKNDVQIAGGGMALYDASTGKTFIDPVELNAGQVFHSEGVVPYRDYQFDYGFTRFIYRRDLILDNNLKFPLYTRFEDPPFFVAAQIAAEKFYAIPDCTYRYRIGEHVVDWSDEKTLGLIHGLADDLRMSQQHGLARLHALTVRRMQTEYCGVLRRFPMSPEVMAALVRLNCSIDPDLLDSNLLDQLRAGDDILIQPFRDANDWTAERLEQIVALDRGIELLTAENVEIRGERDEIAKERDSVYASKSYKLGNFFIDPAKRLVQHISRSRNQ